MKSKLEKLQGYLYRHRRLRRAGLELRHGPGPRRCRPPGHRRFRCRERRKTSTASIISWTRSGRRRCWPCGKTCAGSIPISKWRPMTCAWAPTRSGAFSRIAGVIVEAFDRADMKLMIIETASEHFPDKFIVAGSGLAGYGNNNDLRTRRLGSLFICGDETSEVTRGTAAPGAARGRGGGAAGQPGAGDRHGRPGAGQRRGRLGRVTRKTT